MRASKGLLFSLMVFLLLGSLMALRSASEHNQGALGAGLSESYAFRRVSDKYANVSKNLTDLTGNEAEKSVDQRILPFTYGLDGNAISVSFEVPVNSERVQNYIETLSAFRVFMEDTNYGKEYDSMRTDINTLNPVDWGGEDRIVSFVRSRIRILPHFHFPAAQTHTRRFEGQISMSRSHRCMISIRSHVILPAHHHAQISISIP